MDRRTFLGGTGAVLLAAALAAEAQGTGRVPVVGILNTASPTAGTWNPVLRRGLRDLGYVESQTIALELRHANGLPEALPGLAAELVHLNVDVLVAVGPAAARAARDATVSIPIIAIDLESDPIQSGLVRSFARPGGNLTGFFLDLPSLTSKWLELLREAVPGLARVAVLWDPTTGPYQTNALRVAARRLGLEVQLVEIRDPQRYGPLLTAAMKARPGGLTLLSSPLLNDPHAVKEIADFTVQHHLPAISMFNQFAEAGGLMAYGMDQVRFLRPLAVYVDKIIKGTKPADLPIEQPDKFNLVINMRTAKALGLTIPPSLLARADQVIE
jgi:putative ABC transport system substrate-binding protein